MKFRFKGTAESDELDSLSDELNSLLDLRAKIRHHDVVIAHFNERLEALEEVKPPPSEWETLFRFKKGDLTVEHYRLMREVDENKRIEFDGGKFSVSKSRPRIDSDGLLVCERPRVDTGVTSKQVQIRIIHDSFVNPGDAQHWYLPFGGEYRIHLKCKMLNFPDTGPGQIGNTSDWSQLLEGWGPETGLTPTWQILTIGDTLRGVIEAGDRFGSGTVSNQNEVPFDPDKKSLTVEYKPHPTDGYFRCPDVGLDWQGCTVLTHDRDGNELTHGPCINGGYYGGLGRGFAYEEIKVERKA